MCCVDVVKLHRLCQVEKLPPSVSGASRACVRVPSKCMGAVARVVRWLPVIDVSSLHTPASLRRKPDRDSCGSTQARRHVRPTASKQLQSRWRWRHRRWFFVGKLPNPRDTLLRWSCCWCVRACGEAWHCDESFFLSFIVCMTGVASVHSRAVVPLLLRLPRSHSSRRC